MPSCAAPPSRTRATRPSRSLPAPFRQSHSHQSHQSHHLTSLASSTGLHPHQHCHPRNPRQPYQPIHYPTRSRSSTARPASSHSVWTTGTSRTWAAPSRRGSTSRIWVSRQTLAQRLHQDFTPTATSRTPPTDHQPTTDCPPTDHLDETDNTVPFAKLSASLADTAVAQAVVSGNWAVSYVEAGDNGARGFETHATLPPIPTEPTQPPRSTKPTKRPRFSSPPTPTPPAVDEDGNYNLLPFMVDPDLVFGRDNSLSEPHGLYKSSIKEILEGDQVIQHTTPHYTHARECMRTPSSAPCTTHHTVHHTLRHAQRMTHLRSRPRRPRACWPVSTSTSLPPVRR